MRTPRWVWILVAFFFFAGLGLALWEETSWIGIGQIWMAVAVFLAFLFGAGSAGWRRSCTATSPGG